MFEIIPEKFKIHILPLALFVDSSTNINHFDHELHTHEHHEFHVTYTYCICII